MYRRYQHPDHIALLDSHLEQVARYIETGGAEGIGRLIVEMPPRHGKTLTTSVFFPLWFLGRNPDCRVILTSYAASLANKNSRRARNLMRSPRYSGYFPGVALAEGSQSAEAWDIAKREGGLDAMGVLGGATGKGAHLLDIDDLLKNREEAESETIRERTWDAFTDDLYTRLEPGGAIVWIGTRWHMDDPMGRALRLLEHENWVHLRIPAVAEVDDPLGRAEGAALWPERYPLERLREIEKTLGPYAWPAEYQQNPVAAEGGLFKRAWFEPYLDSAPPIVHSWRYWDLAMSEKTSADYTVGVKLGQAIDGHYYILDVARARIGWDDVTDFLALHILEDGPDCIQGIEEKGYMSRAVQNLNLDVRLHGYSIFGYPVDKDKWTRALPFAAKCAAGVIHTLNRHWTPEYVEELCVFNSGVYDDQVDASSGAWAMADEMAGVDEIGYQQYEPLTIDRSY